MDVQFVWIDTSVSTSFVYWTMQTRSIVVLARCLVESFGSTRTVTLGVGTKRYNVCH